MPKPLRITLELLAPLALCTIFFIVVPRVMRAGEVFEFDRDEGFNLMKAVLHADGLPLYSRIWSDQPPLFTLILARWFDWFGQTVLAARMLVVCFATLLLGFFYVTLRLSAGVCAALAGVALLVISAHFVRLSASVMIGIPSLALAMGAIALVYAHARGRCWYWLIASAAFMALSLHTKLFTAFLIPLLLAQLLLPPDRRSGEDSPSSGRRFHELLLPPALWLCALLIIYFTLGWLLGSLNYDQLITSHTRPLLLEGDISTRSTPEQLAIMRSLDVEFLLPAIVGVAALAFSFKWQRLFPLAWLIAAYIILANHTPVWDHHYLLLSLPLAWLAANAAALLDDLYGRWKIDPLHLPRLQVALAGAAIIALAWPAWELPRKLDRIGLQDPAIKLVDRSAATALFQKYKDRTTWVLSDRPMYVFRAGLRTIPEMTVLSKKRYRSGAITAEQIIAYIKQYNPEQAHLARFLHEDRELTAYLNVHYVLHPERHWIRRDLCLPIPLPQQPRRLPRSNITLPLQR